MEGRPQTQFARSGDLSIAYQVVGDGPIDLVVVPGFMSHVELNWEYAFYRSYLERLAEYVRLVVLDKRGTGLSDRSLGLGTLEERMDDVRAVMDAAGLERATLLGISEGAALCALMAATHPERVSALILLGGYCPGADPRPTPEMKEAFLGFIGAKWTTGEVIDRFVQHVPDPEAAVADLARLERYCCTSSVAVEIMRRNLESDIGDVLPTVSVPTLICHQRQDPVAPAAHAVAFADAIPGAELHLLAGDFHGSWIPSDYEPSQALIRTFLTGSVATAASPTERVLSTVLFTDIVDSTATAAEMGDARWRLLLDEHDTIAREEVSAHGGVLIEFTGDGFLARFDGPSRAVSCAHALSGRVVDIGLRTRAGAHTGEIELRGGTQIGGIAVHIAALALSALAGAGEVLVSRTVKDLTVGSGLTFEDRGEHALKGVPEPCRIYATTL